MLNSGRSNLDELAASLLRQYPQGGDEKKDFSHAFIPLQIQKVLQALRFLLDHPEATPIRMPIFCSQIVTQNQLVVFATQIDSGTLIWSDRDSLPFIMGLSSALAVDVHWIDVHEQMRLWAYICFEKGECRTFLAEPIEYWKSNMWTVDDLRGIALRKSSTIKQFLNKIRMHYSPSDTYWTFERWQNWSPNDNLSLANNCVASCIKMSRSKSRISITPIGDISATFLRSVKSAVRKRKK